MFRTLMTKYSNTLTNFKIQKLSHLEYKINSNIFNNILKGYLTNMNDVCTQISEIKILKCRVNIIEMTGYNNIHNNFLKKKLSR